MAMNEPPSYWQYKPGDFLAVSPLNQDEIIDDNDDYGNWVNPESPNGWRCRPRDGSDNADGQGDVDTQRSDKELGKGRLQKM